MDPERTRALGDEMVGAWEQAYAAELTSRILLGVAVALAGWSTWSFLSSSGPEGGEAAAVPVLGGRSAGRRW